jgi:hypothetical protein
MMVLFLHRSRIAIAVKRELSCSERDPWPL